MTFLRRVKPGDGAAAEGSRAMKTIEDLAKEAYEAYGKFTDAETRGQTLRTEDLSAPEIV